MAGLAEVLREWGTVCAYCTAPATTRDHLVPASRGGSSHLANLRPACQPCNVAKGALTPLEWLGPACPPRLRKFTALYPIGTRSPTQPATPQRQKVKATRFSLPSRRWPSTPRNRVRSA